MCISVYHFILVLSLLLPCIIILFLPLLSIKHKCTQSCYFSLILKPAAQKVTCYPGCRYCEVMKSFAVPFH
jgi:hypothetical protein